MNFPELPIEPPEPAVFSYCSKCGHEIYVGERIVIANGEVYHTECMEGGSYEIAGG